MMEDKVVIVTGSSRGIGRAIALALAEAGAKVVATARPSPDLDALAQELGSECLAWPMDVRSEQEVLRLFTKVDDRYGRVDVLVNNAGIATSGPFVEYTLDSWRDVMSTNRRSAIVSDPAAAQTEGLHPPPTLTRGPRSLRPERHPMRAGSGKPRTTE